jgi:hypothetical protein
MRQAEGPRPDSRGTPSPPSTVPLVNQGVLVPHHNENATVPSDPRDRAKPQRQSRSWRLFGEHVGPYLRARPGPVDHHRAREAVNEGSAFKFARTGASIRTLDVAAPGSNPPREAVHLVRRPAPARRAPRSRGLCASAGLCIRVALAESRRRAPQRLAVFLAELALLLFEVVQQQRRHLPGATSRISSRRSASTRGSTVATRPGFRSTCAA